MADRAELSGQIRRGIAWVGLASGAVGALDAVTTVICLWRWVSPAELGTATIASAMFPVIERIATLGLGSAAVRSEPDRRTLSTIAWTALCASLGVLGLALAASGAIGRLFTPIVGGLMIGYAIRLVVQNAYLIPEALLRKELRFDAIAGVRIAAMIADSLAKLGAAYAGAHGFPELRIWCFVIGPLANVVVTAIGLVACRPWWPALAFDPRAARRALGFGVQVSLGELLYFLYTSADYLVIGRVFGDAAVGAYRLAYELVLDLVRLVSMVTGEVAFAAFARLAGDRAAAAALLVRFTRQNLLAIAPILVVIGVCADDWLALLYPSLARLDGAGGAAAGGSAIGQAAAAARILCAVGALRAASFVLPPMLAGIGHARDALLYNLIAAIALPAGFVVAAAAFPAHGYLSVAAAWAVVYPLAFSFVLAAALARTGVSLARYLRATAPVIASAAVAAAAALVARALAPEVAGLRVLAVTGAAIAVYAPLVRWFGLGVRRSRRSSAADRT
ncbi:MAG TPA: oligosaccharide flippase family protein [Kofleriaceae bacterium]|nr:oligosaccharide flippase family protein [Kofleriaceae bacterium]